MILRRRLTFQLTPLLDLLLIVIFAQFMEVQETVARTEAEIREESMRQLAVERASLATHRQRYRQSFEHMVQQQVRAGNVLSEVFQLPNELVEDMLRPRTRGSHLTEQEEHELRAAFERFKNARGREIINKLVTYDELRKRSDVWEVYVAEDGHIQFGAGQEQREFRAESIEDFEQKLFEAYKTLPQPKSLVVILFSYGDAQGKVWQSAMDGLPGGVARMRQDREGRNWFEFTILGYNPRGRLLK